MPLAKVEEHENACAFLKIDNRKTRKILRDVNLEHQKTEREIEPKFIPKDRRFERIQITNRLRKKLDAKKSK